jgi:hypothetical protein
MAEARAFAREIALFGYSMTEARAFAREIVLSGHRFDG